jgi:hypothetical protein
MYALIHQTSGMTLQKLNARRIGDKAAMARRKTMFRAPWENTADKGNWENANEWERRFSGKVAEADKAEVKAYQVAREADNAAVDAKKAEAAKAAATEEASRVAARQANQAAQEQKDRDLEAATAAAKQAAVAAAAVAVAAEAEKRIQAVKEKDANDATTLIQQKTGRALSSVEQNDKRTFVFKEVNAGKEIPTIMLKPELLISFLLRYNSLIAVMN